MNIQKMIFISWTPTAAPLKTQFLYATAKENLRAHLDLNGREITMDNIDEVPFRPLSTIQKPPSSRKSISELNSSSYLMQDTHQQYKPRKK